LKWISPLDTKGIEFLFQNNAQTATTLRFEVEGLPYKNTWATPGRKMRHDWGYNRWEAFEDRKVLLHTYSNPIDATRTPCTALWLDRAWNRHSVPEPPKLSPALAAWIEVEVPPQGELRFGFLHADRKRDLLQAIDDRRSIENGLDKETGKWNEWTEASLGKIEAKIRSASATTTNATSPLDPYRETFAETLARTRTLFLSNGGVLTRPITLAEYPLDVRDQAIGLNHWIGMGLEFPFWKDGATWPATTLGRKGASRSIC